MSKKSRRLFRQRINSVKKRHTDYLKHIIKDKIDLFQSYYNDVYSSSSSGCSSIVSVRSKKRLLKQRSKLKNHWFPNDTVKAIYGKSYCPQPRKVIVKKKSKRFRVVNTLKFIRLRCEYLNRIYLREDIDLAIQNMLKTAVA